ncbi:ADP-sugar pyrophosphatase-like isoform X1 [Centruroides vittatus]|uniref:ADP-sugar pyrophosphatase-like isoform X1 n=2 Tax=Centruroides vittatus TaxID=120091 RepID=UPI00350EB50B
MYSCDKFEKSVDKPSNTYYILKIKPQRTMSSPDYYGSKLDSSDYKHISEEAIATGNKLNLAKYTYKDSTGLERTCEVVSRQTKQCHEDSDCVGTLAVLRRMLKYDCLVLVKQYRPALKAFTLEFPAGLVQSSESAEETAVRELKEETGYTFTSIKHESPATALDPGLSNCTMKVVSVEIDGDNPLNKIPIQKPADEDHIEVVHIPIDDLLQRLNEYSEQGIIIDSRVYCFAIGHAVGAKHSLNCNRMTIDVQ